MINWLTTMKKYKNMQHWIKTTNFYKWSCLSNFEKMEPPEYVIISENNPQKWKKNN